MKKTSAVFRSDKIELHGRSLVEASAGTGKTYSITNIYARLIVEKKYTVDRIAVVTFTEAATSELVSRIRRRLLQIKQMLSENLENGTLPDEDPDALYIVEAARSLGEKELLSSIMRCELALRSMDEAAIYTIHSFCMKLLKENSFESFSRFDLELSTDEGKLLCEFIMDFTRREMNEVPDSIAPFINFEELQNLTADVYWKFSNLADPAVVPHDVKWSAYHPDMQTFVSSLNVLCAAEKNINAIFEKYTAAFEKAKDRKEIEADAILQIILASRRILRYPSLYGGLCFKEISEFYKMVSRYACINSPGQDWDEKKRELIKSYIFQDDPLCASAEFFSACSDVCAILTPLFDNIALYKLSFVRRFIEYARLEFSRVKESRRVWFFSDLINDVYRAVERDSAGIFRDAVKSKYSIALIDEFQDTDALQSKIFSHLFENLIYIGDPKQSIYRFRGADIFSYVEASSHAAAAKYTLETNWRSDAALIRAVNALFSVENPFALNGLISFNPVVAGGGSVKSRVSAGKFSSFNLSFLQGKGRDTKGFPEHKECHEIIMRRFIDDVLYLLDDKNGCTITSDDKERPLLPSDIAVLVRSNGEADEIRRKLSRFGVPCVVRSSMNVFDTPEFDEIVQIIAALNEPSDAAKIRSALSTRIIGFNFERIVSVSEDDIDRYITEFYSFSAIARKSGFLCAYRAMTACYKTKERVLSGENGFRAMTNFDHIAELVDSHLKSANASINYFLYGFSSLTDSKTEEKELRIEKDERSLQIMTIHKSKGLEFPVVFCPYIWKNQSMPVQAVDFHDDRNVRNLALSQMKDVHQYRDLWKNAEKLSDAEDESEALRLLYVALTRAKYSLFVYYADVNFRTVSAEKSAFAYLIRSRDSSCEKSVKDIIKSFCAETESLFVDISSSGISSPAYFGKNENAVEKTCRSFSGVIDRSWKISSYSSLAAGRTFSGGFTENPDAAEDLILLSDFPKGPSAGSALHSLFEIHPVSDEIDFALVSASLRKNGIFGEIASKAAVMMREVFRAKLSDGVNSFRLTDVDSRSFSSETEFYFSIGKTDVEDVLNIMRLYAPRIFADNPQNSAAIDGFMHGFIDLVFKHNERYYIIDWKSNYLGSSYSDYTETSMEKAMTEHAYGLQLYLYSLALHLRLSMYDESYSFEKNFGGAFYVFLRGVRESSSGGIYFHRPPLDAVLRLNKAFGGHAQ